MKKRRILALVMVVTLVSGLVATGCAASAPSSILYGSSSVKSSWYVAHAKMAELGDKAMPNTSVTVVPGGAISATQGIYDGELQLAGIGAGNMVDIALGRGAWADNLGENKLRALYSYGLVPNPIAVRADSDIYDVMDFEGTKIFLGNPGGSTESSHIEAFKVLGINYEAVPGNLQDGATAFKDRRADGFLKATTGTSVDATHTDIMTTTDLRFIGFTDEQVKKIKVESPSIAFTTIPAKFYVVGLPEKDINVIVFIAAVAGRDDFPEELAYQWTKSVIENWGELAAVNPASAAMDPLESPTIISQKQGAFMHPGAIRYFREKGVDVPDAVIPPEMK